MTEAVVTVLAAFDLALLSAVAGFGGGVLLLPVFTVLFGLRAAIPILTLTQLSSNGSRVWLNRRELRRSLIGWFALGAVPCAVLGGLLLAHAPPAPLQRLLGVFLIGVVTWRRIQRRPRKPAEPIFTAVGAGDLLTSRVLLYGIALTPATLLQWVPMYDFATVDLEDAVLDSPARPHTFGSVRAWRARRRNRK
ncbi:sulfite exporter TauE/SafE family protein [Actinosynnema sp. NPDC051121]